MICVQFLDTRPVHTSAALHCSLNLIIGGRTVCCPATDSIDFSDPFHGVITRLSNTHPS